MLPLIYLVGMPGSGKSTLGKSLARNLSWTFYDVDLEIEKKCGASISWIFELEGEVGFRARETSLLQELSTLQNAVIATGGGTVLSAENRKLMRATGQVVYLRASLDTLCFRVGKSTHRPLLAGDSKEKLKALLEVRSPLYQDAANITIDSLGHVNPRVLANNLIQQLT